MRKNLFTCLLAVLMVCIMFSGIANACTSVIVGRNVSETGEVLLGHNEDNGGRLVMSAYKVPRMKHEIGEMINLEPGKAQIPQVEQTWSYLWSETRSPSPGASFSDFFINEWGVAITSDSCINSKEDQPYLQDGGIGYGIRRLIAERATTAREGVEIAASLINTYGYFGSARSYQIVDKQEGWLLQIVNGNHYVAQRVPDDAVAVISNHYTIRAVDLSDHDNFIASPDLITYAIQRGWYDPKGSDDYKDFDFAKVYQRADKYNQPYNVLRQKHGYDIILGDNTDYAELPFAIYPNKKVSIQTVKNVLRSHYEGTSDDLSQAYDISPHFTDNRVICTATTQESFVAQFRDNPDFTVIWHATGHPCTSAYVPWYLGMTNVPQGFFRLTPQEGMNTHFNAANNDFDYDFSRAWWEFQDAQNIIDPQYGKVIKKVQSDIQGLEKQWQNDQEKVEKIAYAVYKQNHDKGVQYLTDYSNQVSQDARLMADHIYQRLANVKVKVLTKEINLMEKQGEISIAILSNEKVSAASIELESVMMGFAYQKPVGNWIKTKEYRLEDINQDGKQDLIVTFDVKELKGKIQPCYSDIWITAKTKNGETIVAKGLIAVK